MPYYEKSEDWLKQSALLLDARPETARVTTSYKLRPSWRKSKKAAAAGGEDAAASKPPRGHLVLKTYDPHSGVSLKYKTSKAAEVSRLVQMLGTLGRKMAALPPAKEDERMADAPGAGEGGEAAGSGVQTPVPGASGQAQGQQPAGGGAKGKKKKGKR
ncbi:hypothetical protein GQ53DRAFT_77406 [Thozetella sp. PMI_491]|nr:hypothetical protein GQ53DRAFT_77406 [Thozetella sp. PMI_491]